MSVFDQELISFTEASKLIPGRPSIQTLYRWALRGLHGNRLKSWKIGHSRVTSKKALEDFILAQNEISPSENVADGPATSSHKVADAELEKMFS